MYRAMKTDYEAVKYKAQLSCSIWASMHCFICKGCMLNFKDKDMSLSTDQESNRSLSLLLFDWTQVHIIVTA